MKCRPLLFALLATVPLLTSCAASGGDVRSYVLRLSPGMEVKHELAEFARREGLEAASVVSAVGSLTKVALRYANQHETTLLEGHFEVVALSGHLSANDLHLHLAASDGEGRTFGGHLMEGNVVYTTLVVVIEEHLRWRFLRRFDPASGYEELLPVARDGPSPRKCGDRPVSTRNEKRPLH